MNPCTYPMRPVSGGTYTGQQLPGNWAWTPKLNGWRTLVHIPTGAMFNRHGDPLSINGGFTEALGKLRCTLDADAFQWADCEALERRHNIAKGTLFVLDVIPEDKYEDATYADRRTWLEDIAFATASVIDIASINPVLLQENSVYLVPNDLAPAACWTELQALNLSYGLGISAVLGWIEVCPYKHSPPVEVETWQKQAPPDDIEPQLHGPFPSPDLRDEQAVELRRQDSGKRNGLFRLDLSATAEPDAGPYSGAELE